MRGKHRPPSCASARRRSRRAARSAALLSHGRTCARCSQRGKEKERKRVHFFTLAPCISRGLFCLRTHRHLAKGRKALSLFFWASWSGFALRDWPMRRFWSPDFSRLFYGFAPAIGQEHRGRSGKKPRGRRSLTRATQQQSPSAGTERKRHSCVWGRLFPFFSYYTQLRAHNIAPREQGKNNGNNEKKGEQKGARKRK